MNFDFLRSIDKAKHLTNYSEQPTFPQIVSQTLVRILEVIDSFKVSKRAKFHTRTIYLCYLLAVNSVNLEPHSLMKIAISCLFLAVEIGDNPEQIDLIVEKMVDSEMESYIISQEHASNMEAIRSSVDVSSEIATPYDFISYAEENLQLPNFCRAAELTVDIALTIAEISSMSAQEIFVGSCLFICDKHYKQMIVDWLQDKCMSAMGVGFELKHLLKIAYEVALDDSS